MSDETSSFDVSNQIIQSNPDAGSSKSVGGSDGNGMLPIEGKSIDVSFGSVDSVFNFQSANMDSFFGNLNAGGGALGGSVVDVAEKITEQYGAVSAKGDPIDLKNLGAGDRPAPPTMSEIQLKSASFRGSDGGQSAGG
jgi:hypothetical protein